MEDSEYEAFAKEMQEKHPVMFSRPFGGFCIGPGWYQIIRSLCGNIQAHINSVDCARTSLVLRNPWNRPIPKQVPQVIVTQIKEKFGGLRFYHDGGDDMVEGMVHMAESWAAHTCETCGNHGVGRSVGGWLTTLCDMHYNERLEKFRERNNENR
jgi:hypothetical protein